MENSGTMILTRDNGIWDYTELLDALLDNGYLIAIVRDDECFYIEYKLMD